MIHSIPARTQAYDKDRNRIKISWEAHLRAYAIYSALYGNQQSAERIHERGGFGEEELNQFYPEWRNHIVE